MIDKGKNTEWTPGKIPSLIRKEDTRRSAPPVPSPTRIFERDGKCDGERRCSHPVTSQQVEIITNLPAMAELLKQPSKYWLVNFLEFRKITYLFRSILVIDFFFLSSQKYSYGAQSSLLHDSICQCRDLSSNRCNSLINI